MGAHLPPLPSKVIANQDEKEAAVAIIELDGIRLGTAADAGALCVTSKSQRGVSGDIYRFYVRSHGAPKPYMVRDALTGAPVPARDGEGRELFDLAEVERWNASRPGSGARKGRPMKWTQLREDMLTAARDEKLRLSAETGRPVHPERELDARAVQGVGELVETGLLLMPPRGGQYRLTEAGRVWLDAPPEREVRARRARKTRRARPLRRARPARKAS